MRPEDLFCKIPDIGVSIHAPREGCDLYDSKPCGCHTQFQFTHPGRGATPKKPADPKPAKVSIHAPREGCDQKNLADADAVRVSIHAPREGCDEPNNDMIMRAESFNSRTPGGVRPVTFSTLACIICFNSRTPGGVRPAVPLLASLLLGFQFTHPGRGATDISEVITTALTEFQFTHPGRGATSPSSSSDFVHVVSIHAPREGCDGKDAREGEFSSKFQFTHPGRGATAVLAP